jgi:hypothetical protein
MMSNVFLCLLLFTASSIHVETKKKHQLLNTYVNKKNVLKIKMIKKKKNEEGNKFISSSGREGLFSY